MARIVPHLNIEPEKNESEVWARQQALCETGLRPAEFSAVTGGYTPGAAPGTPGRQLPLPAYCGYPVAPNHRAGKKISPVICISSSSSRQNIRFSIVSSHRVMQRIKRQVRDSMARLSSSASVSKKPCASTARGKCGTDPIEATLPVLIVYLRQLPGHNLVRLLRQFDSQTGGNAIRSVSERTSPSTTISARQTRSS